MEVFLFISVFILLVSFAWIVILIAVFSKKVKNKQVLKRYLQIFFSGLFMAFLFSCSPGKMVGTGYLVSVEKGRMFLYDRVETSAQADSFILKKTGLIVNTDSLIGKTEPYWDLKNGRRQYIYVEKKGIYQRRPNGKKRWRVYNEY